MVLNVRFGPSPSQLPEGCVSATARPALFHMPSQPCYTPPYPTSSLSPEHIPSSVSFDRVSRLGGVVAADIQRNLRLCKYPFTSKEVQEAIHSMSQRLHRGEESLLHDKAPVDHASASHPHMKSVPLPRPPQSRIDAPPKRKDGYPAESALQMHRTVPHLALALNTLVQHADAGPRGRG